MPFWVFNVAQIDGLPPARVDDVNASKNWADRSPIEGAMRFIGGCRPDIRQRRNSTRSNRQSSNTAPENSASTTTQSTSLRNFTFTIFDDRWWRFPPDGS